MDDQYEISQKVLLYQNSGYKPISGILN
jgi:hypothetical protein